MIMQSDGEKSDQDLVVDDASDCPTSPVVNGTSSPRENGIDKLGVSALGSSSSSSNSNNGQSKKELPPHSPRSGTSSNASTPSAKKMEDREKATTPISKPLTPTSATSNSLKSSSSNKAGLQGPPPPGSVAGAYPAHYPPGPPHHLPPGSQHPAHVELMAYSAYAAPRAPPSLQQQLYDPHGAMRVPPVPVGSVPGGKP
jgi:groucho